MRCPTNQRNIYQTGKFTWTPPQAREPPAHTLPSWCNVKLKAVMVKCIFVTYISWLAWSDYSDLPCQMPETAASVVFKCPEHWNAEPYPCCPHMKNHSDLPPRSCHHLPKPIISSLTNFKSCVLLSVGHALLHIHLDLSHSLYPITSNIPIV